MKAQKKKVGKEETLLKGN